MKTGLKKQIDMINNYRKSQDLAEELNEMRVKMMMQKEMEDALRKR